MESEVVRADAVLQVTPQPRRQAIQLVYVLIFALGFLLIALGAHERASLKESWLPEICIALGVAIAAPGILSYLYRKYLLEEVKLELQEPALEFKRQAATMVSEVVTDVAREYRAHIGLLAAAERAGLIGLHMSRSDAVAAFAPYMEEEKQNILIIGSSLKGLLQSPDGNHVREMVQRKQREGVQIRFLLTHPAVADLRAQQEGRSFTAIGGEIIESLTVLTERLEIPSRNIKLYLGTPTCFAIRTSKAMLLNTYSYMREAYTSPCLVVMRPGYLYEHFAASHFAAWESALALPVDMPMTKLALRLETFAGDIKNLLARAHGDGSSSIS